MGDEVYPGNFFLMLPSHYLSPRVRPVMSGETELGYTYTKIPHVEFRNVYTVSCWDMLLMACCSR